ncbi:hypothetical protein GCM10025859_51340 [Alicyclobacillus fastidiosus]|nr:hypothetical protein GCM10025859_51340 [Alicyclobacillus fastidiosus]
MTQAGGADHMYVLTEDADVEALASLPQAVHEVNGKIALQLFHSGRYAFADEIGMQPVAPSPIASRLTREVPREMTDEDIADTILAFAQGARRAMDVGYDAVEIMGSEGYLLNQFLSPSQTTARTSTGARLSGGCG